MIHLPQILSAAVQLQQFCQERNWRFCFIGGVAVQRWGNPRMTQDVDLTLLTGFGQEEQFVDELLDNFLPRNVEARAFALSRRVLLLRTQSNIDLDIALGAFPFEERSIERASLWTWAEDRSLLTCSAEDLVVHKTFAGRDRDWADVESILVRQYGKLNTGQILKELEPLLELKGEKESLTKLERMLAAVERRLRSEP